MPIVDSLAEAEQQTGNELAPKLAAYASASERAFNSVGLVLGAAPEVPFREVPLSRKVSTVLMVRLSNDLRGVALLALRGYALQAAALAASMFEVAYCIAYIGSNEERATAWIQHDDPTQPFRRVKSLTDDVMTELGAPDPMAASATQYRVYRQLCLAKHSNPLLQQDHGHYANEEAVFAMNGPDASEGSVRVARFALEHATRFTILALATFLNHHVPPENRASLVERVQEIQGEVKALAQGASADYGNDNPFPGEW